MTATQLKRDFLEMLSMTPAAVEDIARDMQINVNQVKDLARGTGRKWGVRLLDNMVYVQSDCWKTYKIKLRDL